MRWLFERVRFVGVDGVFFGLVAALTAFALGGCQTVETGAMLTAFARSREPH